MKTITVGEFKSNFSEVIEDVKRGMKIAVTFGKKKEIVGYFMPEPPAPAKRQLGIWEGKLKVEFGDDWEMTEEEFLGQ